MWITFKDLAEQKFRLISICSTVLSVTIEQDFTLIFAQSHTHIVKVTKWLVA